MTREGWVILISDTPYRSIICNPPGSFLILDSDVQALEIIERFEAKAKLVARVVPVQVDFGRVEV
jgi:hypothetical protein